MRSVYSVLLLALLAASTAFPAAVIYTDQTAWQTAAGSSVTEPFDSGGLSMPGLSVVSTVGAIQSATSNLTGSVWHDRPTASGETTTFTYASGVNGLGGLWDLAGPGGEGMGLLITLNLSGGGTYVVPTEIPSSSAGSFWGLMSDQPFDSFRISAGTQQGSAETYELDNLELASAIPEPATWGAIPVALAALGLLRRRLF